jgi:hypothetical protein
VGELQHEPFQFTFNGFLKVAFQGSFIALKRDWPTVKQRLGLK